MFRSQEGSWKKQIKEGAVVGGLRPTPMGLISVRPCSVTLQAQVPLIRPELLLLKSRNHGLALSSFAPLAIGTANRLWLSYDYFCSVSFKLNVPLVLFPVQPEMPPHNADEMMFLEASCFSSNKLNE